RAAGIGHAALKLQLTRIPEAIDPDSIDGDEPDVEQVSGWMDREPQWERRRTRFGEFRRREGRGGSDSELAGVIDGEWRENPAEEVSAKHEGVAGRDQGLRRSCAGVDCYGRTSDRHQSSLVADAERRVVGQELARMARVIILIHNTQNVVGKA